MSVKTFAAIDVGSFELTMKIFDLSGKNTMREIDCIRQRIDLGSDTYAHGKISNEKIDDLCHTLKEFAQIMESYKVTAYKAYGTSAIRETENTLILQDQIEQRTGIWVETLSNSEQRFLDYKSIASKGETFRRIISQLMEALRTKGTTELAKRMDIAEEKVPLVYISAILTRRIAELMGAELVWAPGVTLCDGIAYEYAEQNKMFRGEHDFAEDIIACALNISKRYNGSSKRADTLEHITTTIFDSMKKVHGMGQRERLYLRLAAILHDCGKYISLLNVGEASYDIIMATEMIGLSHMEREIVANVVRFNHSDFVYYGQAQERPMGLDKASYLTVAKLTAILRLANSLDRSHKQKMKGVKAVLQENELILKVDTQEDITLEKGFFQTSTEFFKEVYSITPVIRQKKKF